MIPLPLQCPTCGSAANLVATYAYTTTNGQLHSWNEPMPTGTPAPRPCPTDPAVTCSPSSVDCRIHNWHAHP